MLWKTDERLHPKERFSHQFLFALRVSVQYFENKPTDFYFDLEGDIFLLHEFVLMFLKK